MSLYIVHMSHAPYPLLDRATAALASASSVVVFTGAGVSAESGVPTYRSGADGLWSAQNMERYANPSGYARHLPDSYLWYKARADGVAAVHPNTGHYAIAELETRVPEFTLVTQNIDSLHQRAGSRRVLELHGHLRTVRCAQCDHRLPWTQAPSDPRCPSCSGMLRPEVVMFEEVLPQDVYQDAVDAASRCDVLISVGTSNVVFPAAELPMIALRNGATAIIVNPDMAGQPSHQRVIPLMGLGGDILPRLLRPG